VKKTDSLFRFFAPVSYELTILETNKGDTEATVIIKGRKLPPPSHRLVFHQKGLKVIKASLVAHTKKGDRGFDVQRINHHKSFEQVRLHTRETLYPGEYTIKMKFTAEPVAAGNIQRTFTSGKSVRSYFPSIDEPPAAEKASLEISKKSN
jgi:hypothetical protein